MTTVEEIILIVGMVLATFSVRFPLVLLATRIKIPIPVQRALSYVPIAVLTAISTPMLLKPEGHLVISHGNEHLIAGLIAIFTAAFSGRLLLTILVGMTAFLALRFLL